MENRYKLTLDMKNDKTSNIKFKQGDTDSSVLEINLIDNSLVKDITGQTITFNFLKADGTVVVQDITTGVSIVNALTGNFQCILKNNTLAYPGIVKCEITFTSGTIILSTATFNFTVGSSISGGILSTNYISQIESKMTGFQNTFTASETTRTNTFNTNEALRTTAFSGMTHIDANLELSTARGGQVDLNTRLNNNDASLAQKPQQTYVDSQDLLKRDKSIKLNATLDFDDETKTQMTGVTPITYSPIPSSKSIAETMITDDLMATIHAQKNIVSLSEKINLYDKSTDTAAGLDYNTGSYVTQQDTTYQCSEPIAVDANCNYELKGRLNNLSQGFAALDSNKVPIRYSPFTQATTGQFYGDTLNGVFKTGANIKFVQFTTADPGNNSQNAITLSKVATNLYNQANDIAASLYYDTGALNYSDGYGCSELIATDSNSTYKLEGRTDNGCVGFTPYDKNQVLLPYSAFTLATTGNKYADTINGTFNTGTDIKFVRFVTYNASDASLTLAQQKDNINFCKVLSLISDNTYVYNIDGNNIVSQKMVTVEGQIKDFEVLPDNPVQYCDGDGSGLVPYTSDDGTSGFAQCIENLSVRGGKIRVPANKFSISSSIILNKPNINIEGDIWNYSHSPNGVCDSQTGSKIALSNANIAAIILDNTNDISGGRIAQIGVQGTVLNGNTQGLFSVANAAKHCAINMFEMGVDQFELQRINCCGLSAGIAITGGSIDSNIFEKINADGCNVGIYFHPTDTYYTKIRDSLLSDCPAQGLWVGQGGADLLQMLVIDGLVLVRNCGGITTAQLAESEAANALITGVVNSIIKNCQIDATGTWWEYFTTSGQTVHTVIATGLILDGTDCMVVNNYINGATGHSAQFRGSGHEITCNRFKATGSLLISGDSMLFSNNIVYSDNTYSIEVTGNNNKIINGTVNKPIHVTGSNNTLIGFETAEIVDNGTGTIIK